MHFSTLHDFLMMGGYACYVWPAYGLTFIVLLGNAFSSWWRAKRDRRA